VEDGASDSRALTQAQRQRWELGGPPPVEHRFMGLDKRLILPTLAILAIQIVLAGVIPAINEAIKADEFPPGTVLSLRGGVEFTPAQGWIPAGVPHPASPELTIFRDGVRFTIASGDFKGTSQELLDELISEYDDELKVAGDPRVFALSQGIQGAGTNISAYDSSGVLLAFVTQAPGSFGSDRNQAIRVQVKGPSEVVLNDYVQDIADMIASIRVNTQEGQ
jgi:hypothetical protein